MDDDEQGRLAAALQGLQTERYDPDNYYSDANDFYAGWDSNDEEEPDAGVPQAASADAHGGSAKPSPEASSPAREALSFIGENEEEGVPCSLKRGPLSPVLERDEMGEEEEQEEKATEKKEEGEDVPREEELTVEAMQGLLKAKQEEVDRLTGMIHDLQSVSTPEKRTMQELKELKAAWVRCWQRQRIADDKNPLGPLVQQPSHDDVYHRLQSIRSMAVMYEWKEARAFCSRAFFAREGLRSILHDVLTADERKHLTNTVLNGWTLGKLLLRASRDGSEMSCLLDTCCSQGPTLTLVRRGTEDIFGGFIDTSWEADTWTLSSGAFVFSLRNPKPTTGAPLTTQLGVLTRGKRSCPVPPVSKGGLAFGDAFCLCSLALTREMSVKGRDRHFRATDFEVYSVSKSS